MAETPPDPALRAGAAELRVPGRGRHFLTRTNAVIRADFGPGRCGEKVQQCRDWSAGLCGLNFVVQTELF